MAEMVDAWRTLILDFSIWSKLGSQTAGLIAVLAISGSVVLLALGKQKLLVLKHHERTSMSAKNMSVGHFFLATEASRLDYTRMLEVVLPDISKKQSLDAGTSSTTARSGLEVTYESSAKDMSSEDLSLATEPSALHNTRMLELIRPDDPSEVKNPNAGINCVVHPGFDVSERSSDFPESLANEESSCKECKKSPVLKKVRFSADVIEPSGDNREYRRRMKSHFYQRLAMEREGYKTNNESNRDEPAMATQRNEVNTFKLHHQSRLQTMASSKLLPNRKALYAGMQRYRLERMFLS